MKRLWQRWILGVVTGGPWDCKPTHWWSPTARRQARLQAKVLAYQWEHGGEREFFRSMHHAFMYGELPPLRWPE